MKLSWLECRLTWYLACTWAHWNIIQLLVIRVALLRVLSIFGDFSLQNTATDHYFIHVLQAHQKQPPLTLSLLTSTCEITYLYPGLLQSDPSSAKLCLRQPPFSQR